MNGIPGVGLMPKGTEHQGHGNHSDHQMQPTPQPNMNHDGHSMPEMSIEFGAGLNLPSNRNVGGSFDIEYLYGFALNSHLVIGIDPSVGGKADTEDTDFDVGNIIFQKLCKR